jgi:1,4-dihydroxy-2-naphthoate octaprenyltransferase
MTVNLLGWFYSAPPVKFSYRGLGEVIILTIIGFVLPGSGYFMIKESIDRPFYIFMAIFEIYGLYFILNVQIPDIEADILAKKKTVASYLGSKFSFVLTGFLALIGTSYLLAIPIFNALPSTINFRLIGLVSMVPLITGFMGCVLQTKFRRQVFIFTNLNVLSLAVLLSFVDCYFLFLLLVNGK